MTSLLTLPVHLVYHILDDLQPTDIFLSAYNVCSRLNSIIDSYHPYQVKTTSILTVFNYFLFNVILPSTVHLHNFLVFAATRKTMNLDKPVFVSLWRVREMNWNIVLSSFFHPTSMHWSNQRTVLIVQLDHARSLHDLLLLRALNQFLPSHWQSGVHHDIPLIIPSSWVTHHPLCMCCKPSTEY